MKLRERIAGNKRRQQEQAGERRELEKTRQLETERALRREMDDQRDRKLADLINADGYLARFFNLPNSEEAHSIPEVMATHECEPYGEPAVEHDDTPLHAVQDPEESKDQPVTSVRPEEQSLEWNKMLEDQKDLRAGQDSSDDDFEDDIVELPRPCKTSSSNSEHQCNKRSTKQSRKKRNWRSVMRVSGGSTSSRSFHAEKPLACTITLGDTGWQYAASVEFRTAREEQLYTRDEHTSAQRSHSSVRRDNEEFRTPESEQKVKFVLRKTDNRSCTPQRNRQSTTQRSQSCDAQRSRHDNTEMCTIGSQQNVISDRIRTRFYNSRYYEKRPQRSQSCDPQNQQSIKKKLWADQDSSDDDFEDNIEPSISCKTCSSRNIEPSLNSRRRPNEEISITEWLEIRQRPTQRSQTCGTQHRESVRNSEISLEEWLEMRHRTKEQSISPNRRLPSGGQCSESSNEEQSSVSTGSSKRSLSSSKKQTRSQDVNSTELSMTGRTSHQRRGRSPTCEGSRRTLCAPTPSLISDKIVQVENQPTMTPRNLNEWVKANKSFPELKEQRRKLIDLLTKFLNLDLPSASYEEHGSRKYGIDSVKSDLDLAIRIPDRHEPFTIDEQKQLLECVSARWFGIPAVGSCAFIHQSSRVLIARVQLAAPGGLHFNIMVGSKQDSVKTMDMVERLPKDSDVSKLAMCVKEWAKRRGIGGGREGNLPSFGYVLMAIHYHQTKTSDDKKYASIQDDVSLDDMFHGFLRYYAKFDWNTQAISVHMNGLSVPKSAQATNSVGQRQETAVMVLDPQDDTDNIGWAVQRETRDKMLTVIQNDLDALDRGIIPVKLFV